MTSDWWIWAYLGIGLATAVIRLALQVFTYGKIRLGDVIIEPPMMFLLWPVALFCWFLFEGSDVVIWRRKS